MSEQREPDLDHHPNLNKEPLRTGNRPETQADREDVVFSPPTWVVDRMSAGVVMLVIAGVLIAVGVFVVGFLLG